MNKKNKETKIWVTEIKFIGLKSEFIIQEI